MVDPIRYAQCAVRDTHWANVQTPFSFKENGSEFFKNSGYRGKVSSGCA
jgi:hypothetical protein